jgi:hypothetical protein
MESVAFPIPTKKPRLADANRKRAGVSCRQQPWRIHKTLIDKVNREDLWRNAAKISRVPDLLTFPKYVSLALRSSLMAEI